ncbi:hypothetical protein BS78_03G045000 [Paspalum vaginatum]|nr:hypothetical protein BS78_03G045000 [Paspalum vaginatum]KAJ1282350.1 hypothetical protein BS78_03G045000 [Paspalum vaginatum]
MAVPTPSGTGLGFSVRPPAPAPRASCAATRARAAAGAGANWWAPLLGWSGQPDYIDAARPAQEEARPPRGHAPRRGALTEDKARQLRVRMMETASFHDAMYHSAIASRLASAAPHDKR